MWISICVGLAIFMVAVAAGSTDNRHLGRNKKQGEWLFTHGFHKVYDAFFEKSDPVLIGTKLGLVFDKYMRNCRILRTTPDLKKEVSMRFTGTVAFGISLIAAVLANTYWVALIGLALYYCLGPQTTRKVEKLANKRRKQLADQLPRFIDLFQTAIGIGMPVETAIKVTAQNIPCVVSEELLLVTAETELGAKSWQQALEHVAIRYEVDVFSDFVLSLTTAYEKGIPIAETVLHKSAEIKQLNLLDAKERAAKLSNTILVPVMIFKVLPLLAIMLIPIIMQISAM